MLNEGSYRAVGISAGLGIAGTGTEQIGIMFRISSGQDEGATVGWRGFFSEKTTQRTIESLRNCGWNGTDLSVFAEANEAECLRLLPAEVEIVIEHEQPTTPNGKAYAKVKWVNKLGTGTVSMKERLDPSRAKSFAERMRGACAAVPVVAGVSPRPTQPTRPAQRTPANHHDEPPPGLFDDNDDFPR